LGVLQQRCNRFGQPVLVERAEALNRKLAVIGETATALTDLKDAERSLRLEMIIVLPIAFEVLVTIYNLVRGVAH
jgi:uncharacterized Rmd1/YagE family protein